MPREMEGITREIKAQIQILTGLLAVMWLLVFLNLFIFRGSLLQFGIIPRTLIGLRGILFAPFLHGGIGHVLANTIPFLVLGWLIMLRDTRDFFSVSLITMLISGLGVWVFGGAYSVHVGASGVVFGYLGYLLLRGYFERSGLAIFLAIVVGILYGGLLWGVLPSLPGISWQGHLFGFIGGGVAARYLAKPQRNQPFV